MYATLLEHAVAGNLDATESLGAITQAAKRAGNLVQQILAFSRPTEQERRPAQLRHVVNESIQLLRASIPTTVEMGSDVARDLPLVLADTTQVHQVVMNLGTNAWHAMRKRPGRLDIKLSRCELTVAAAKEVSLQPGHYVQLTVSDTGCGMTRIVQERIFEPFFTTKAPGEGTGLGLSVVHGIVRSHDGAIRVQSEPGRGTKFQIYFPVHDASEAVAETGDQSVPRGNGQRVMVVDDEEILARLGAKTLEALGYRAEPRTNPQDALEELLSSSATFEAVITDQTMPRLTGLDLAEQVLRCRPDLPILLTTGFTSAMGRDEVIARGLTELLYKPFTVQALGHALDRALCKGRVPSQTKDSRVSVA